LKITMVVGKDDTLLHFADLCRNDDFRDGFIESPNIGITTEELLKEEMLRIKDEPRDYQNGYYIGTCYKNGSTRLHKLGGRKLRTLEANI